MNGLFQPINQPDMSVMYPHADQMPGGIPPAPMPSVDQMPLDMNQSQLVSNKFKYTVGDPTLDRYINLFLS